jgi:outer membrane protein with beta-barrel domain
MRILGPGFLCFALVFSLTTHAQLSIGIKGGPDFSRLINVVQGNDGSGNISVLKSGTITQYYGGIYLDIPLDTNNKMFYLRPGVDYIGAGGNMNPQGNYYNANGFQPSTKYSIHYVDVPLEFVFRPTFGWGGPLVGFGLYGGALVNGTIKNPDGSSHTVMIGNKSNDNFQRFDFGYAFTFGLALKSGFLFGFDYQHSLIRVVPSAQIQSSQERLQTRNAVWGIHVGWAFKL